MTGLPGTVRRTPDGLFVWRAHSGAGLGPVTFDAYGIGLGVDGADPATVLTVVAEEADRDSGATCFVDPEFLNRIIDAEDGAEIDGPELVEELVRVATIHAVDAFHVGPLDEAIVALDAAHAAALSGDMNRAHGSYMMASATVESLLERLLDSDGGKPIADELENMVARCPAWDADHSVATVAAAVVDRATHRWSKLSTVDAPELAVITGQGGQSTGVGVGDHVGGDLLDLALVPSRMFRFTGPDQNDLTLRRVDDQTIEAYAVLRDEIIAESTDVDGMFLLAVDGFTGELISSAPCVVDGMALSARIWLADNALDDVHFLLVARDVSLSNVHADAFAVLLSRLDRECRFAWSQHRRATALQALVVAITEPAPHNRTDALDQIGLFESQARSAVSTATVLLQQYRTGSGSAREVDVLDAYLEGVQRLGQTVGNPGSFDGPMRATLAELCAEAGW